jgi:hypothetical protein
MINNALNTQEEEGKRLRQIENQLRSRYEELRRKTEPAFASSSKSDAVWIKTTEVVDKLGANPWDYIDAQFQACVRKPYPYLNCLYQEQAIRDYHEYREKRTGQPDQISSCQMMYLDNLQSKVGLSKEDAILHDGVEFYAWFRCMVAPESVLPKVLSKYGEEAKTQIEGDSRLRSYLRDQYEHRTQLVLREKVPTIPTQSFDPLPPPSQVHYRWEGN